LQKKKQKKHVTLYSYFLLLKTNQKPRKSIFNFYFWKTNKQSVSPILAQTGLGGGLR